MRVGELLGATYLVYVHTDVTTAVVAELRHINRNAHGGSVETPIGMIAAAPAPPAAEAERHWNATLVINTGVRPELRSSDLPEAVADWLLAETACEAPLLVNVYEGRNTTFVQRGEIWDD
jgi:hypothetical protein